MAQGKFGGGTGIPASPYLIEDAEDLSAIRFNPKASYKLAYSINLGVLPYNSENGWLPIKDFAGTLDGNGKKIYNLYIKRPDKDGVGLFEKIKIINNSQPRIFDLGIENADVTGREQTGLLAGTIFVEQTAGGAPAHYLVDRCCFTGKVTASKNGGGIFGVASWDANSVAMIVNLVQDTFIDVFIQPSAVSLYFGAVAGTMNVTASNNFKLSYVISACSVSTLINGLDNAAIRPTSFGLLEGHTVLNKVGNCFYDSTRWTTGATAGTEAKSTVDMTTTRFGDFDQRIASDGSVIWDFTGGGRYPLLRQFFLDRYFIRTTGGYQVYAQGKGWVVKYTTMPTRAQAVDTGMKSLSEIPFTAWDALGEGVFDLINIVELSNGTVPLSATRQMILDGQASSHDKNYYSTEIQFKDFGHNIITLITKNKEGVVA